MEARTEKIKVAVIGSGISGIAAAYALSKANFDLTLYESDDRLGGHTNTILTPQGHWVDTGFIICNRKNYPLFYNFLEELCIPLRDTSMSFGMWCKQSGLTYVGPQLKLLLANPKNLLNWKFLRMLVEQRYFHHCALRDLKAERLSDTSVRTYLRYLGLSSYFHDNYLQPLAASIWSCSERAADCFPCATFVRFFDNHGMLDFRKVPQWQTIEGGSKTYVEAFERTFRGTIHRSTKVLQLESHADCCTLTLADKRTARYHYVVCATHADQALHMLLNPSLEERRFLETWSYSQSSTILHSDVSVLPPNPRYWAAWNYVRTGQDSSANGPRITYNMNILQGLPDSTPYLVSLNLDHCIDPTKIIYQTHYTHPIYTAEAVQSQSLLNNYQGRSRVFFCGSYCGYGFHEDGYRSGFEVARKMLKVSNETVPVSL